ncbi:MAG: hypothetical protein J6I85_04105 [Clostridia bacterium]|nr:hypothetical protein [Clostridia bacterium]
MAFWALVTVVWLIWIYFRDIMTTIVAVQNNGMSGITDSNLIVCIVEKKSQKEYFQRWVIKALKGYRHVLGNSNEMKNSLLNAIWIQYGDYP